MKDLFSQLPKCYWQTVGYPAILVCLGFFSAWNQDSPGKSGHLMRQSLAVRTFSSSGAETHPALRISHDWSVREYTDLAIWSPLRTSLKNFLALEVPCGTIWACITARPLPFLNLASSPPFHTFESQECFLINILDVRLHLWVCFPGTQTVLWSII